MAFPRNRDGLARSLFVASVLMLTFAYGAGATEYDLFPVPLIRDAKAAATQLLEDSSARLPWYYHWSERTESASTRRVHAVAPGLRVISGLGLNKETLANVVDVDGRIIHTWVIDWRQIWPNPDHLPPNLAPKTKALVHGLALSPDGDLIFNIDGLGLVRMNACGQVVWKLPYRTHHSIELDERGNIWASGVIGRNEAQARLPNYRPPFDDFTILEVSPGGKVLKEFFVADLLMENDLKGLLYMASRNNDVTTVRGDTLHLNDVEPFPASLTPGLFALGDVLISLRNINTVLVFDSNSRRIKYLSVGTVLRQHDPDFVDGNTISVFDNNNLAVETSESTPDSAGHHSRIVALSPLKGGIEVLFSGSREQPFFTHIMGKQQRLPNGNLLLTESVAGRVLEVDRSGTIVWEYFNVVGDGRIGLVDDALWLPPEFTPDFFARASAGCRPTPSI
jgi:hypothetical protein